MRSLWIFPIFVLTVSLGYSQAPPSFKSRPFNPKDFPEGKFRVTKNDFPVGEFTVRVIAVKNLGYEPSGDPPHWCRAWVEVRKSDQLVKRFFYGDIEPLGFGLGAFVPKSQPGGCLAVVKEGDYDGRLLLIDREGRAVDLPGGFFFVTADKNFLISEHSSDAPGLTGFDLANHKVILRAEGCSGNRAVGTEMAKGTFS